MVDLGNVVLGIDDVVRKLQTDHSLGNELALKAGVFTGDVMTASPVPEVAPVQPTAAAGTKPFRVRTSLPGASRFDAPPGATVVIQSEARYDTPVDVGAVPEASRPPVYWIYLYRAKASHFHGDRQETAARQYRIGRLDTAEWYNLDGGQYYIVIENRGSPNFVLEGSLSIDVRRP